MLISYKWLKEFVDFKESPAEIADILLSLGLEAVCVGDVAKEWKNVVTAKVLEVKKHPNADKLSLCLLNDGAKDYSVVCGASNVSQGQVVPLALIGAVLPGNFEIKRAVIRGVESEGMICSEKELGLVEHSIGIMVLPAETPLGMPFEEYLRSADTIFEVEITTNRSDCLSHWGIAREIAAKLGKKVKLPEIKPNKTAGKVKISVNDFDLCPRYIGCRISGVKVGHSPSWLVKKLEKCGLRPINNIVDITNYVMMELGHPLHAFDLDTLSGNELVVRTAKPNERIKALDGKEYKLDAAMLVIADGESAQAIAGVMGGEYSGVTETTKTIILESAVFKPQSIRRTSKALNLSSDSSYRFERGTGWTVAETASNRAAGLILEIAGGKIEGRTDLFKKKYVPTVIELRHSRAERILGSDFTLSEIEKYLKNLSINVRSGKGKITAEIPSWRLDLKEEIDLIEEIARVKGYDKIPSTIAPIKPEITHESTHETLENALRAKLAGLGFNEALNYSFCENEELMKLNLASEYKIANPLSLENEFLRPSLFTGLYKNLVLNISEGYSHVKLFETGVAFTKSGEKKLLGILLYGKSFNDWWDWEKASGLPENSFYFLNGLISALLGPEIKIIPAKEISGFFHPGKIANISINEKIVGQFGMIRPDIASIAKSEVGYAEIDLGLLSKYLQSSRPVYSAVIRQPFVRRDLSLLAPKTLEFSNIDKIMAEYIKKGILRKYQLFSVYKDEKIGIGTISYSLHLTFRHSEHTLTDQEVNNLVNDILSSLKSIQVSLRI